MSYLELAKQKLEKMKWTEIESDVDPGLVKVQAHVNVDKQATPLEAAQIFYPVRYGWVVAYRAQNGRIAGGTVTGARPRGSGWTFTLSNGVELSDLEILSVGAVEGGQWLGAWTVKRWGLTGPRLLDESR